MGCFAEVIVEYLFAKLDRVIWWRVDESRDSVINSSGASLVAGVACCCLRFRR